MASKLIIVMVNTDPRNGEELGAPFFQATVAAAMDYEVDVVCTATAGQLMKKGVAEKLTVKPGSPKTVYDFIKEAHEAGVLAFAAADLNNDGWLDQQEYRAVADGTTRLPPVDDAADEAADDAAE